MCGDDPELARSLRIEERELEAGGLSWLNSKPADVHDPLVNAGIEERELEPAVELAAAVMRTTNQERAQRMPRCPRRSASSRRRACFVGRVRRSAPSGRES